MLTLPCCRLLSSSSTDNEESLSSNELQCLEQAFSKDLDSSPSSSDPVDAPIAALRPKNSRSALIKAHAAPEFKRPKSHSTVSMLVNDCGFIRFRQDGDDSADGVFISTEENSHLTSRAESRKSWTSRAESRKSWTSLSMELMPETIQNTTTCGAPMIYDPSKQRCVRSASVPVTARAVCCDDLQTEMLRSDSIAKTSDFSDTLLSFKPPSSIHLRDSIDKELNYDGFYLQTPQRNYSSTFASISSADSTGSLGTRNRAFSADAAHLETPASASPRAEPHSSGAMVNHIVGESVCVVIPTEQ